MKKFLPFYFVVLLFLAGCKKETPVQPKNYPPEITSLSAEHPSLFIGESTLITCKAVDPDGDNISYSWKATGGSFSTTNTSSVTWYAPNYQLLRSPLSYLIYVDVEDSYGNAAGEESITITVSNPAPEKPQYLYLYPTDDAYVSSSQPNTNFGSELGLYTGDYLSNYSSYLKFNISSIPTNIDISKVDLEITVAQDASTIKPVTDVFCYYISNQNWSERSITYSNKPPKPQYVASILRDVTFHLGSIQRIELTSNFKSIVNTDSNYSLLLVSGSFSYNGSVVKDYGSFYSKETNLKPTLVIEYYKQ